MLHKVRSNRSKIGRYRSGPDRGCPYLEETITTSKDIYNAQVINYDSLFITIFEIFILTIIIFLEYIDALLFRFFSFPLSYVYDVEGPLRSGKASENPTDSLGNKIAELAESTLIFLSQSTSFVSSKSIVRGQLQTRFTTNIVLIVERLYDFA